MIPEDKWKFIEYSYVSGQFWQIIAMSVFLVFPYTHIITLYLTLQWFYLAIFIAHMGVIPNPKMAFIFPISCILALIFWFLWNIFPNVQEKVASQNQKQNHCPYKKMIF